ncbi:MAG: hypothetical protein R3F55_19140 [Alphaproteobacteria bacterium]
MSSDKVQVNAVEFFGDACVGFDELPEIDQVIVDDWRSFFTEPDFARFLSGQCHAARRSAGALAEAGSHGPSARVAALAHDLASTCGGLGMARAHRLAAELELASDGRCDARIEALLPRLLGAIEAAASRLETRYPAAQTESH